MSYSSLLHQSISTRRDKLYKERGLDIEQWIDLVTEAKSLKKEISKIAADYDESKREREEEEEEQERNAREPGKSREENIHDIAKDGDKEGLSKKQKESAKDVNSVADL